MKKPNLPNTNVDAAIEDASNIEADVFIYSIDEHNFREMQLLETNYLTPELQSLVTENMSDILYHIQTIVHELNHAYTNKFEENCKLSQCNLKKTLEQYCEELLKTKHEIDKMQQSISIYKNEINKLMRLIYARNCLIEKLTQENKALQKQQNNSGSPISSKILF